MMSVFIGGEGRVGPPYSCLNKTKTKSWFDSVFGVTLQNRFRATNVPVFMLLLRYNDKQQEGCV